MFTVYCKDFVDGIKDLLPQLYIVVYRHDTWPGVETAKVILRWYYCHWFSYNPSTELIGVGRAEQKIFFSCLADKKLILFLLFTLLALHSFLPHAYAFNLDESGKKCLQQESILFLFVSLSINLSLKSPDPYFHTISIAVSTLAVWEQRTGVVWNFYKRSKLSWIWKYYQS